MKHLLLALSLITLNSLTAQIEITSAVKLKNPSMPLGTEKMLDTISTYLDRSTGFYTLGAGPSGYVLGTSNVTTETATHFSSVGVARVTEAWIYFSHKTVMNTSDDFTVSVYSSSADSMPNTLLATATANVANVNVTGFPTIVAFPSYSAQSGDFLINVDYTTNVDDTLVLFSNNATTTSGGPDGAMEKRVRQKALGTWMRAYDIWTISGNQYNADAIVIPIVDIQSAGVQDFVDFKLISAYPCPANDDINLTFELTGTTALTVKIMDARGALLHTETLHGNGLATVNYPTKNLSNGQYYYVLQSDTRTLGSKFQIQH